MISGFPGKHLAIPYLIDYLKTTGTMGEIDASYLNTHCRHWIPNLGSIETTTVAMSKDRARSLPA
jgi:hypothetical protein